MIDNALYSIETNLAFPVSSVPVTSVLSKVLNAFGYDSPRDAKVVEKANIYSSIHFCSCGSEALVVRASEATHGEILELQCQIFRSFPEGVGMRPLKSCFGNYVHYFREKAWIVYPYLRGALFDGSLVEAQAAFARCLNVIDRIRSAGLKMNDDQRRLLPQVNFDAEGWRKSIAYLCTPDDEAIRQALGADLCRFLATTKNSLLALIERLAARELPISEVTHYDLQHANIVITSSGPQIIDLEDVYSAPPQVAACHAAFKLARHTLFVDQTKRCRVVAEVMPEFVQYLKPLGIAGLTDLFEVSAIRTINDLNGILDNILEKNQSFLLYDLRKKALNLLEAADLTACRKQVGLV